MLMQYGFRDIIIMQVTGKSGCRDSGDIRITGPPNTAKALIEAEIIEAETGIGKIDMTDTDIPIADTTDILAGKDK
jgi:hypothetical protein